MRRRQRSRFNRRTRRGYRISRRVVSSRGTAFPLGRTFKAKLKYSSSDVALATAASGKLYQWRLNSFYDPDYTYAGHQPYGYDQIINFFNRYTVTWVKFRFWVMTNNVIPSRITLTPYNGSFFSMTSDHAAESPLAITKMTDGSNATRWSVKYIPRKIVGASKQQYYGDTNRFSAANNTNPTEQINMNMLIKPPVDVTATVYYTMIIGGIFWDPVELNQS